MVRVTEEDKGSLDKHKVSINQYLSHFKVKDSLRQVSLPSNPDPATSTIYNWLKEIKLIPQFTFACYGGQTRMRDLSIRMSNSKGLDGGY